MSSGIALTYKGNISFAFVFQILAEIDPWPWTSHHCSYSISLATLERSAYREQAKGYPDVITRSFLDLLHENIPWLPILILVDFDPDGLNIFRCYRYGSDSITQRAVSSNTGIRWLGINSSQILELAAAGDEPIASSQSSTQSRGAISATDCREPISQLSARDRKAAIGTLGRLLDTSDDQDVLELRRELQVMLMMGVKAEIQWLDEAGSITEWLDWKIGEILSVLT